MAAPVVPARQTSVGDPSPLPGSKRFWPEGWWKLMEFRIGVLPLPVFVVLTGIIVYFAVAGKFPTEICMMMAVLAVGGFGCGEIGKRLPVLHHLGAAAVFATFVPSALVFYKVIPAPLVAVVTDFTKGTNFLYLFIAAVIVGSILGMDRTVLVRGFIKIFIPMAIGSVLAAAVGTAVGSALGLGARHTFFYIVMPAMAGGVGEGAIPLSAGYAGILHLKAGDQFALVLPPVMFASLTAIVFAGLLNYIGRKVPRLTGEGRLQPGEHDALNPQQDEIGGHIDVTHVAAAGSLAITLYLLGLVGARQWGWPAPVVMLVLAVIVKLGRAVSPKLQQASYVVYRFFATAVTYPLLFAIGIAMTPWDKLISAFALPNLVTIVATVATMTLTGFGVARWIKMYPVDLAIITSCRCSQGGTGDVAILTASNRMQLMPFAQIATRLGGAATVIVALAALKWLT